MEKLRKFNTKEEYQTWKDSDDYSYPNVCKVADEIIYNGYPEPFWIESVEDISVNNYSTSGTKYYGYWSYDKVNWVNFNTSGVILRTGEKIYIHNNKSSTLFISGKYNVGGSILSLVYNLDYLSYNTHGVDFFKDLFKYAKKVVNAKDLILADVLPEYTLNSGTGPYETLFKNCSLLQSAPKLPNIDRTTNQSFKEMFSGCNSLTAAPTIKRIGYSGSCCAHMFSGCSNLSFIKLMNDTWFGISQFDNWVDGVSTKGTFITVSNRVDFTRGKSGIPEGWDLYLYDEEKGRYVIKFKVNNIPYEYYTDLPKDITWNEFINSVYNTNGFTAKQDESEAAKSIKLGDDYVLLSGSKVVITDKVVINASYTIGQPTQTTTEEE